MKHRKIVCPERYFRDLSRRLNRRTHVTQACLERLHLRLFERGWISSSLWDAPPFHERVFVPKEHAAAKLMLLATANAVVPVSDVVSVLGTQWSRHAAALGIAVVPVSQEQVRLVGTSPALASLVNRHYHGQRRRRVDAARLLAAFYLNEASPQTDSRRPYRTEKRLEAALLFICQRFGCDWSDLIDRPFIRL